MGLRSINKEKWSLYSFLTTAPQQADVTGNILLFFYKKKRKQNKKNKKILPATSACCETVVRNECMDHSSLKNCNLKIQKEKWYLYNTSTTTLQHPLTWGYCEVVVLV
jgi:hypothetical protein